MAIARENKLFVVEDCAHAIESKFQNQHCGTGDIYCFRFMQRKILQLVKEAWLY